MPSHKAVAIIEIFAIGSVPFLGLGILAVVARIWKPNLRATLPWLRALRWTTWLVGVLLVAPVLLPAIVGLRGYYSFFFPIGGGLVPASIGLGIVEGCVKRWYAPELIPPQAPDGYWPSPRD